MRSRADGDGPRRPRVVVVGGGVAGLTAAYRLAGHRPGGEAAPGAAGARADVDVQVLEASGRAGGKLLSVHVAGGVTVEGGADSLLARKPWALDLCRELGLGDELVAPGASGAHIWARGRPVAIPAGGAFGVPGEVATLLRWPGLSVAGRLRALLDLGLPPRLSESDRDESVGALLTRRLGREAAATMVGPLVSGIAAGDLDLLSVRASFPELAEAVRRHGSLIRATRAGARRAAAARAASPTAASPTAASPTAPPPAIFLAPSGGTARLTEALADAIGPERILLDARASAVRRAGDGYAVEREGGEPVLADAVVLAVPAYAAAALVVELAPRAAAPLTAIPYVSTASVALVFPAGTGRHLPPGTGFLFPRGSAPAGVPAAVTAFTWLSRKWPRPSYGDRAVVRAFVGRRGDERALELGDGGLVDAVLRDLDAAWGLGARPEAAAVQRWDRAMPQYDVGHLERVAAAEGALASGAPGVLVTGSAYRGVGVADCVRQGAEAAERVRRFLEEGRSWTR